MHASQQKNSIAEPRESSSKRDSVVRAAARPFAMIGGAVRKAAVAAAATFPATGG